jgi:omega-6 fatty acid desaturase (delta-12 desaturase)
MLAEANASANAPANAGRPAGPATADWRAAVAPYIGPDAGHAIVQLVTTLLLLAASLAVGYWLLERSIWAALAFAPLSAGLLVRTFIFMHDCAHGSFLPWRRVSDAVGYVTGVLTLTPFGQWRRDHALHHASSGDLERRGHGDVPTLTVREYLARSPRGRLVYRTIRHPVALLLGGPVHLIFSQRFRPRGLATGSAQVSSVWATNAGILLLGTLAIALFGWESVVLVYLPAYYLAAMAGVWLFYVQHQFEDAYWESGKEWDYATAALHGSSHLVLPPVLQWFTGSIGLHHVHHLAPRIPNHKLQRCHDSTPLLQTAPVLTLRSGIAALKLSLWDEERGRMVRFGDVADRATS